MKTSTIIREAVEQYLWDGVGTSTDNQWSCLCLALTQYAGFNPTCKKKIKAVKRLIHARLGTSMVVEEWLGRYVPEYKTLARNNPDLADIQVQAYRRRWAESIADEFQAQGD